MHRQGCFFFGFGIELVASIVTSMLLNCTRKIGRRGISYAECTCREVKRLWRTSCIRGPPISFHVVSGTPAHPQVRMIQHHFDFVVSLSGSSARRVQQQILRVQSPPISSLAVCIERSLHVGEVFRLQVANLIRQITNRHRFVHQDAAHLDFSLTLGGILRSPNTDRL